MEYKGFYITHIEDCSENKGGYFCQVYTNSTLDYELDYFCIHKENLINSSLEQNIIEYIDYFEVELKKIKKRSRGV